MIGLLPGTFSGMRLVLVAVPAAFLSACGPAPAARGAESQTPELQPAAASRPTPVVPACQPGPPMAVHFYDAGQALSVLVTLPDGRHILVDAGESPRRPCAGCKAWHQRVLDGLQADLGTGKLDLLWITHQHSDHLGGAPAVIEAFQPKVYTDNGLDLTKTEVVKDTRAAATSSGAEIRVVDPEHPTSPLQNTGPVVLTPIVPSAWPAACKSDANACSIGLRIDYCRSSVLFTGDASSQEEALFDTRGPVTLLQVAHHGAETSTSAAFVAKVKPKYAVISSAKPEEGTNDGYCHPRAVTVRTLTEAMGGAGSRTVKAFDGTEKCKRGESKPEHWQDVPASDRLWTTARDGGVTLTTTGDGAFAKQ